MTDIFTPQKRSEIMSKVKSKDSMAELLLRRSLFQLGARFRIHSKTIYGKPDISISKLKVAIFVDGDWWHGKNYKTERAKYSEFWRKKIQANMNRDQVVNKELKVKGWIVIRYWQKDIERNYKEIALELFEKINRLKEVRRLKK